MRAAIQAVIATNQPFLTHVINGVIVLIQEVINTDHGRRVGVFKLKSFKEVK